MSRLLVLTENLMDASRVQAIVPGAVAATSLADAALSNADVILLDLASSIAPSDVVALGSPVVAYGPHVERDSMDAAIAAGCRQALPRSKVFRVLPELLDQT
ncbi:MAG: hypothetical protein ACE5F5_07190 [Acidimicrobiia bacterium]